MNPIGLSVHFTTDVFIPHAWQSCGGVVFVHDDVIKWKHFPRYWPFVRGIHRSPVNSPRKGQWRRALMFSLICTRINGWVNNGEAGDLRRYCAHCDVTVMFQPVCPIIQLSINRWNLVCCVTYFLLGGSSSNLVHISHIISDLRFIIATLVSFMIIQT